MYFKQIEKFQCLTSSTTPGLSHGALKIHVARVHKRVLKLVNFEVQKVQKPHVFELVTHFHWTYGLSWVEK